MIQYRLTKLEVDVETPSGRIIAWSVPCDDNVILHGVDSLYYYAYKHAMWYLGRATIIDMRYEYVKVGYYEC